MLSNYARLLNLDAEKILLRFAEGLQAQRGERVSRSMAGRAPARQKQPPKPPTLLGRLITADLIIVGLVILFLCGFAIWSSAQVTTLQTARKSTNPPSISEMLISASTQTAIPGNTPLPPTAKANILSEPTRNTQIAGNPGETPGLTAPLGAAPLQVIVVARQRTWLQVASDRKTIYNGRILPGSSYPFSGSERIELMVGNAAAIQILFNQKDMGTLGMSGQVVNLVFTKDGMRNPTPTATLTPTRTVSATPSISPTPNPAIKTATVTPFIP